MIRLINSKLLNLENVISENIFCAQSFTPTLGKLTRIELQLSRHNKPPEGIELILRIRGNLDGKDITYIKKNPDEIQSDHVWVEFDFPDINVPPGEQRYIIVNYSVDRHDIANCYCWYFAPNNPYPLGDSWHFSYVNWWEKFSDNRDFCFKTYGDSCENVPPYKPSINGPYSGKISTKYNYTFVTTDFDGDDVYYYIDWGDGNLEEWMGPYKSGEQVKVSHVWSKIGEYYIKAKAKDEHDTESIWSDPLSMNIPKSKAIRSLSQVLEKRTKKTLKNDACYLAEDNYEGDNNPPHLDDFAVNRSEINKGEKVMFRMMGHDPDNDNIRYCLDPKSDGNYTRSFLCSSGTPLYTDMIYNESGSYIATAWCEDEHVNPINNELTLNINVKKKGVSVVAPDEQNNFIISKNKQINTPFLNFLENHPNMFPLLRQLLGL